MSAAAGEGGCYYTKGLFAICSLPFGFNVSAPIFQRTIVAVFQRMEGAFYNLDDVLVTGITPELHEGRLKIFQRIKEKELWASAENSVEGDGGDISWAENYGKRGETIG
ncbi:unnamed protein product [Gordionus sp. m RMFG-2023]